MSKQRIKRHEEVSIEGCELCQHHYPIDIFELCQHKEAVYSIGRGKVEWHTCQHMREAGNPCGPSMSLRAKNYNRVLNG